MKQKITLQDCQELRKNGHYAVLTLDLSAVALTTPDLEEARKESRKRNRSKVFYPLVRAFVKGKAK